MLAAPPTAEVASTRVRRVLSIFSCSFMGMLLLWEGEKASDFTGASSKSHDFAPKRLDSKKNFVY
jgi:hypothetical protein